LDKDKDLSSLIDRPRVVTARRSYEDKPQYLLAKEEQILFSIFARAPLSRVLNTICCSLDCQIGNMVSLISLSADKQSGLGEISSNAKLFGLHIYFTAGIQEGSGDELGLLEMYSCLPRQPSFDEHQLIERAVTLAAIAINRYHESGGDFFAFDQGLPRTFQPPPSTAVN
jgi:hypothetical protein